MTIPPPSAVTVITRHKFATDRSLLSGEEGKREACAFESGHLTLLSGAGKGEVVSKNVGEDERGAAQLLFRARSGYDLGLRSGFEPSGRQALRP